MFLQKLPLLTLSGVETRVSCILGASSAKSLPPRTWMHLGCTKRMQLPFDSYLSGSVHPRVHPLTERANKNITIATLTAVWWRSWLSGHTLMCEMRGSNPLQDQFFENFLKLFLI